jgi:outer membrane protein TolC
MTERRDAFDGMNSQTAVGVTWPLELGRRSARAAVAVDGIAKAALLATEAERQVAARVKLAAIRALAADRLLAIATETVEAHQQWCDLIEARVAEGAAAPIDRDVAEVELRQGLAMLTKLRAESAARWAELNAAAGFDSTASFTLSETLEQAVAEVRKSPPALMADALDARADVAAAQAAVEIAEAKTSLARREGGLDLSLNATYMRTASGFPQMFMTPTGGMASPENRMNEFVIGATIMWPWRNRNAGMVAAATAEARTAEFERDALLQTAQAEASAAEIRDIEAGRGLEIYSNGLLTLAAKNRDVITESYALGRVTRFEVITKDDGSAKCRKPTWPHWSKHLKRASCGRRRWEVRDDILTERGQIRGYRSGLRGGRCGRHARGTAAVWARNALGCTDVDAADVIDAGRNGRRGLGAGAHDGVAVVGAGGARRRARRSRRVVGTLRVVACARLRRDERLQAGGRDAGCRRTRDRRVGRAWPDGARGADARRDLQSRAGRSGARVSVGSR